MTTETFYVIAVDETQNWAEGLLAANNIKAAFGLYLVRGGEATHCCSITASSWGLWMRNSFIYDRDDKVADAFAEENEHESGGEDGSYFSFVNPETYDPRFITVSCTVEPSEVDFDEIPDDDADEETRDAYRDAVWENAREYEQGNSHDPRILWESTYDAWQKEPA